ncbi:NAD(P)/FAD-dependent oxidoreductase [uncultured Phenylobacterium sp.]|uniref:flavin-containing monooxygenase n=1 Tax=uncultured Phenylobacterium sp. TaxID=349273 RepID=UPI0025EA216B|nr:NAD(P)/FAD-dependent oxidoreductase [uncultured Phenylobacterium sp.]
MSDVSPLDDLALDFDPDALRAKYQQERDKRVRKDGNSQYVEVKGQFAHFVDDHYVEPGFSRAPLTDDVELVIIGGGFGGLLMGARAREAGIKDIRVIEAGGDFGGTWYWNRYPGAQCDIEAYCYLPLVEELGYMPKEKYSFAPEIYEHSQRIAKHYNLYENACFQTKVTELRWDEDAARWIISTDRDDRMRARFVVMATGPLNRPKLPSIPGITDFEGHTFHTSRWDYNYTGGSHAGGLTKLADKRVAIIGTGATAIQSVPHVGASAKHLYVFQRTPSSVDLRGNKPTDPEWAKSLKPGWQRARRENFNNMVIGLPVEEDMVNDGWTDIFRNLSRAAKTKRAKELSRREAALLTEIADFEKMNGIRSRVDNTVTDPAVAEALKPWYRQFCKRPTFNDDYLPTFNRPNVTLVDTSDSQGVERITKTGIVAGGVEYPVDCIIFATGFEVGTAWTRRAGYDLIGQGGKTLSQYWSDGMKTYHGFSVHGFPNCFILGQSQNGGSVNLTSVLDDQAQHVAYIVRQIEERGARYSHPKKEAETAWVDEINRLSVVAARFLQSCTPGYYNAEGHFGEEGSGTLGGGGYAPGINAFNALMAKWRETGDMEGLEVVK